MVGYDALAIYVHKDNPLKSLSLQEVDAIFSKTRGRTGEAVEAKTFRLHNDDTTKGRICTWNEIGREETASKALAMKLELVLPIEAEGGGESRRGKVCNCNKSHRVGRVPAPRLSARERIELRLPRAVVGGFRAGVPAEDDVVGRLDRPVDHHLRVTLQTVLTHNHRTPLAGLEILGQQQHDRRADEAGDRLGQPVGGASGSRSR